VVQNYSAVEHRRVDLTFNTAYDCDVEEVKALLMGVVMAHPKVLVDPAPFDRLSEHGESALTYTLRAWCKTEDYWDVRFDLVEAVKKEFDHNGIAIPYPQLDVHLDK
jgi:small conductance mechanosensitive channel